MRIFVLLTCVLVSFTATSSFAGSSLSDSFPVPSAGSLTESAGHQAEANRQREIQQAEKSRREADRKAQKESKPAPSPSPTPSKESKEK